MEDGALISTLSNKSSFVVHNKRGSDPRFTITTLHISCHSEPYRGRSFKYGGIIIYGRNDQGIWSTNNNTRCKSGYLVIMQTDTSDFKGLQKNGVRNRGKFTASFTEKRSESLAMTWKWSERDLESWMVSSKPLQGPSTHHTETTTMIAAGKCIPIPKNVWRKWLNIGKMPEITSFAVRIILLKIYWARNKNETSGADSVSLSCP